MTEDKRHALARFCVGTVEKVNDLLDITKVSEPATHVFNPLDVAPDWSKVEHVTSVYRIVELVRAVPKGKTIRVIGSSHSWPQGIYQPDEGGKLICIDALNSFSFNSVTNEVCAVLLTCAQLCHTKGLPNEVQKFVQCTY